MSSKFLDGLAYALFDSMYQSMHSYLTKYACLFVRQYETAEDIVQECWLRLWTKPDTLLSIPEGAREAYVKQCVHNACIDYIRQSRRIPLQSVEDIELSAALLQINKENALLQEAESFVKFDLPALMVFLPRQERLVVEKTLQGYSNKEIAEEMQISVGTVRCYWSRACHRLYSRIKSSTS